MSKWYLTKFTDADYEDDTELLVNKSAYSGFPLHNLKQAARGIGLLLNSDYILKKKVSFPQ